MFNLSQLNAEQKLVVELSGGINTCISGPGTGKSTLIAHKIIYEINRGMDPKKILAISFSKNAASDLKSKVRHLGGISSDEANIRTLHSLCWQLLYGGTMNNEADFKEKLPTLFDSLIELLTEVPEFKKHPPKVQKLIQNYICYCIANDKTPDPAEFSEANADVDLMTITDAIENLQEERKITFDGLIAGVLDRTQIDPNYLSQVGQQFELVIADEMQDMSSSQLDMILEIGSANNNILLVGDPNQSIYSFRFTDPSYLNSILELYKPFELKICYRCSQSVLDAAYAILSLPPLISANTIKNSKPILKHFSCESLEAIWIADEITRIVKCDRNSSIVVLTRTRQSYFILRLEKELLARSVPYKLSHISDFDQNIYYKLLIITLKILNGSILSSADWLILLNYFKKVYGDKVNFNEIEQYIKKTYIIKHPSQIPYPDKIKSILTHLMDNLLMEKPLNGSELVSLLMNWVQQVEGKKFDRRSFKPCYELINDYFADESIDQLFSKLTITLPVSTIYLGTIHSAKGLEWDHVFIPQIYEDNVPLRKAINEGNTDEELRLLFVAMTRPRDKLYLSYSTSFPIRPDSKHELSRFINGVDELHYYFPI